jgi:hypothetical protein
MNTNNSNNSNNTSNNNNVLPEIKTLSVLYPMIAIIVFLIIVLFCLLFKVSNPFNSNPNKSQEEIIADVFIILIFSLLILGICLILLPNLKEIRNLFEQISSVSYVIIYTVFLILFLTLISPETLNTYAYFILPVTLLFSSLMFYKGFSTNYVEKFNVNYERIKTMILFFCFITICIIYYNKDPGGYIQKYFGYSLLLTIIISVFAFLYLIIILTLPDKIKQNELNSKSDNFLNNFSNISSYGSMLFLLFIIIVTIIIANYPGGFFTDTSTSAACMILLLIICILSTIILGAIQFPELTNNISSNNKLNLFKRALLALFGIVISSLIIFWIVYNIQSLSNNSTIVSLLLNILLVIIILALIYKTIMVPLPHGNAQKNAFFTLILNTLFYIPCLFSKGFDSLGNFISGEYKSTSIGSILMLLLAILIIVIYFKFPSLFNKFSLQGGKQLVDNPVYTNSQYSLGTYEELNGSDNFDYQYAISFWIFIDSATPSMNPSYNKFTSLLNFGDKPNVLYNGKLNTLMIIMQQKDLNIKTSNKLLDFDENGNRIIYKKENMLLQKWNNIIFNYNGGVLDIFLNGELVKSDIGVVPYYKLDNLTIGEENGIKGGICNVAYFRKSLESSNIYYLYNSVKDRTPPILNESNKTIIINNVETLNNSVKTV